MLKVAFLNTKMKSLILNPIQAVKQGMEQNLYLVT